MMYLKPLIKKIVAGNPNSQKLIAESGKFSNDADLLEYLVRNVGAERVETTFTQHYGVEYKNLRNIAIDKDLIKKFDSKFLMKEKIIPISYNSVTATYEFAISNLIDRDLKDRLGKVVKANNQKIKFYFAFEHEILRILNNVEEEEEEEVNEPIPEVQEEDSEDGDFNATEWVNKIINEGIDLGASDIHIERFKNKIQLRYRVDGLLMNKKNFTVNENQASMIYVRLKVVSNMNIVESRKSQDGRIDSYQHRKGLYDLRVNSVNTIYGEKFVMRVINKSNKIVSFSDLGFNTKNEEKVISMLQNKNGIIYLAGATGSGKTTTLYSMIDELNEDSVNIYTIENPVEKTIKDVNQIQIDEASGTDYPTILSALLRQDPNIIVVGEIRDSETAELSIRASLTGHLVITTLHANNALDSLSRLTDMGIEGYLVGASSVGFISQVLVRKLCPVCKVKKESLREYEEIWIKDEFKDFDYSIEKSKGNYIYGPVGCDKCSGGYKGRVAVIELIEIDDSLRTKISRGESVDDIRNFIRNNGYDTLKTDGIKKVKDGIISIEELIGQI